MTTVGFGSGSFSSQDARNERSRKRKQHLVRRSLLETLETRQLMAIGPQLIGVQPNDGSLISLEGRDASATVLNTSPREIVLRFDDADGLNPATLASGIRIKRAGPDGILESAYISTDLGSNGLVVVDFSSPLPGQEGNGVEIVFTSTSRTTGTPGKPISWPILSVNGNRINVQVNTLASAQTTASDVIRAMTDDPLVASKILVKRLRGNENTVIANTVPLNQVFTLQGADAARVSSNLGSSNNALQVEFLSVLPGAEGNGTKIEVVQRDFGGQDLPIVTVTGKTVRVEVNSNIRFATTVGEFIDAINNSFDADSVMKARIVSGSRSTRMGINPVTYSPLTLVSGDDVAIVPNFIGFGDTNREVIIRFAERLPDDFYLIDILGTGPFALRSVRGLPFNGGASQSVRFDLDLGTTIQSIVPQPVVRAANGTLSQLRNVIHVYFNDDDLSLSEVLKPQYYQLVYTNNTLTATDDVTSRNVSSLQPSAVNYDAVLNRATLSFNRNLDEIADALGNLLPVSTLRLSVGSNQPPVSDGVTQIPVAADPGDRFANAFDLGGGWSAGGGNKAVLVSSEIRNTTAFPLDFPGANDETGVRSNRYQRHVNRVDSEGIPVINYNFASALGTANNSVQLNAITEPQQDLVRQIFSLYEKYLGVRFAESDNLGLTVAVGDMLAIDPVRALTPVEPNAPGGLAYAAGPLLSNPSISAVVIDIQDFNTTEDNLFGSELFRAFMRGIGVLLGLGTADELPQPTVQNNAPITDPNVDRVFPGNYDIVHGQFLFRPEGKDIDLYRFELPSGGELNIQVAAERLANSSPLDASLRLFRNEGTAVAPRWVEIAANEDYYSDDPRIRLENVRGGQYAIGVSAKGNVNYNPLIADSGLGGKSEGRYELRIDFRPPAGSTLVDANGLPTALDGDGDGRPGGVHNYWFVPTRPDRVTPIPGVTDNSVYTIWVDKTAANNGNGTLSRPYNTISRAIIDAQAVSQANPTGNRNVVVRILGNTQNRAYEIGFNRLGSPMADGSTFDVPKNVTVMIDAGAIIKMGRARIGVGSSTVSVDRSGSALQVLGIPSSRVIITSINDRTGVGVNPDRTPPAPAPGDWGGLDYRNRIDGSDETRTDRERQGLFLNAIYHSDLRYGGGQVFVDGVSQVITPINIIDSRPTIANSLITQSADAAIGATPNSFREDDFLDPRSQANSLFVPDYDRVGPDIYGNTIVNNTLNGLFVRTRTGVASNLETTTVAARFDDTDIAHILGENLIIEGQPGGGVVDSSAPPTSIVTLATTVGGSLPAGTFNYRLVYVDANGNESIASIPTTTITVVANSSVTLSSLPPVSAGLGFVARRLYRSDATGGGVYSFVSDLDAVATSFTDNGTVTGRPLAEADFKVRSRLDGSLSIDPGILVKSQGSRIEVRKGGSLVAEGTKELPIVFTSLLDTSYGVGGTSRTSTVVQSAVATRGDWGGIFVGHASSASLDNIRVSFAGGNTRIEGGFASFNAIEVHQADFRMTNSRITESASGVEVSDSPTRVGRGTNDEAAIFVRGAQPILLNNIITANSGAAINIDVNSLTSEHVIDRGRMTGEIGIVDSSVGNQGPFIQGNRMARNLVNGVEVRGGTTTTQSVWDDSDIVHVLRSEVVSSNTYTLGGTRLVSRNGRSLVVKMEGNEAGFTATGLPLDIDDRLGGSVSLVGDPGAPVILTSISDCTAGAGFTPDGRFQNDTVNSCVADAVTSADVIVIMDESASMFFAQQFSEQLITDLDAGFLQAGIGTRSGNRYGLVGFGGANPAPRAIPVGSDGSLFGTASEYVTAAAGNLTDDGFLEDGWAAMDFALNNYSFRQDAAKYFILVTNEDRDELINVSQQSVLSRLQAEGVKLNGILSTTIQDAALNFPFLALDNQTRVYKADGVGGYTTEFGGSIAFASGTEVADYVSMAFTVGGLIGDISQISVGGTTTESFSNALVETFVGQAGGGIPAPGDWRGVELMTYSNDRNVAVVPERESFNASAPATNDSPESSQFIGQLAKSFAGGDESARLGFEIQGVINRNNDVDVYSFLANGRTEVWLDIDRTTFGLDTVVELVAADGTILALSNDSYLEETAPLANPIYSVLPGNAAHTLRKSTLVQVPRTSLLQEARDDFSTNPKDAGFRVILPGQESITSLYHIRVRSSNQSPSQPANTPALSNPNSVSGGLSRGAYQLQVRLSEAQEYPGSSSTYADIRYARNGIGLRGVPRHSPLVGETSEVDTVASNNNVFANAQYLGNILQTDRQTISIAGNISQGSDIDWYSFDIDYQLLVTPLSEYFSTIFDIDYADGIGRADLSLNVFNANGNLIFSSQDSNIADDRATSLSAANNFDLGRGSTGALDPYLGSVELPGGRYFVAITNRNQTPTVLANRNNRNAPNDESAGIRIAPINSNRNIVEDRVGGRLANTGAAPIVPQFLPESSRVEYSLADVPLYLLGARSTTGSAIHIANAFTGEVSNFVGITNHNLGSIAIRPNGDIRGFGNTGLGQPTDGTAGYILVNPGTAASQVVGDFGLITYEIDPVQEITIDNSGLNFRGITFAGADGLSTESGFVIGNRTTGNLSSSAFDNPNPLGRNILYRFDPSTGRGDSQPRGDSIPTQPPTASFNLDRDNPALPDIILGAGTNISERGRIETNPAPGATSSEVAVTEATAVVGTTTRSLIQDGDTISIRTNLGTLITFEMNSGPELALQFDPSNPSQVLQNGDEFTIDGEIYRISTATNPPAVPGVRIVSYSPTMTNEQFVASLRQSINPLIQIGFDGNRVNFSGALVGSFGTLISRGVARDLGSNGNVGAGRVAVNFLAQDTAATIAVRVAQAANSAGFAGLSASVNQSTVQFVGAFVVATTGSARRVGIAPGGDVTGLAQVGTELFAITNTGGLFVVSAAALAGTTTGNIGTYVRNSHALLGIQFTGLTSGPSTVGNGQYDNVLFGTDINGNIHAFDTNGTLMPVFAGGATSVSTGVLGLAGLAFSNLDYNLWHQSTRRSDDRVEPNGAFSHGIPAAPDGSDAGTNGGTSWYFGFENQFANNNTRFAGYQNPLGSPRALNEPLQNTYNFPGGAKGVLESQPISLTGMVQADKPTLYFNYFLSTEDVNGQPMRDSFRVYGQGDDGVWRLLVTNNDLFENPVERAIDNNLNSLPQSAGIAWRQARVDLGQLAGNREVRLRFEFSTAGGMGNGFFGGKGLELRAIAGSELRDGQTLLVGGRRFELEMGPSLVISSGSSVRNLETISVLNTTFTFWNGTGTSPAGNVISYTTADTPASLANKIHAALVAATYTRSTVNVQFDDPAGGSDTVDRALSVGITGVGAIYQGVGAIGDNLLVDPNPDRDIDLVRMTLQAGTTLNVTASATTLGSPLDPFVRIFDSVGRQLAFNNDFAGSRDSRVTFTVPTDGVYFVGVSGSTNAAYNPNVFGSGSAGGSQGQYQLTIDVTPRLNISVLDNKIQIDGASSVVLSPNSAFSLIGANGLSDLSAAPIYVSQTMTADQVAESIRQSFIRTLAGGTSFNAFPRHGAFLDTTGVTVTNPGPFTMSTIRAEDNLSAWPDRGSALESQNNAFEGLYLDDFVIALGERGEQVSNAPQDTTFTVIGTGGIESGSYQLEIRGGTEYGRPRSRLVGGTDIVRAFQPNESQSNAQVVRFNNAANIADGQTIRLSDGINSVTLEFEDVSQSSSSPGAGIQNGNIRVPFNPRIGESSAIIAARIRDLINSPTVRSLLVGGAISADGQTTGVNSSDVILLGTLTILIPSNIGVVINNGATGDRNTPREQGQVVIEGTKISHSASFGIDITADTRDALSNAPNPGSVRNLITLNSSRLAPGAVITNNVLYQNRAGGINIQGDTVTGNVPTASIPFARVVNNTILGGSVNEVSIPDANTFEGDFYRVGTLAFADRVVSYNSAAGGGPVPVQGLQDPSAALGVPNYTGIGEPLPGQGAVSLGRGGVLVLQFTNNILTGSDDPKPDLAVYQVGISENVRVEVSPDGVNYTFVGTTTLVNRSIDLDAFGFNSLSQLQFVRLTDELNQGALSGDSVGVDIDAIGALSSRPAVIFNRGGTGITVGGNASPSLLNNIIVNNDVAISINATSQSTVLGGILYQNNNRNVVGGTSGQFAMIIPDNVPLFADASRGNLYPVNQARLIDASIDSLEDRSALLAVKQPLGLQPSPIIAPRLDITGQGRVDDPTIPAPPGLGESVFKDRGAYDRSDFVGPSGFASNPLDNDSQGVDRNRSVGIVEVVGKSLNFFDIQVRDASVLGTISQGSGVSQSTVVPASIVLSKDGTTLVQGVDYRFGYDATSNVIRLTPLSGLWETGSVYQIRYVNTNESLITLADPSDIVDGTTIIILDANGGTSYFELDTGIRLRIPQRTDGIVHRVQDGSVFRIDDGTRRLTFEFDMNDNVRPDNIPIVIGAQDLPEVVAQKMVGAILGSRLNVTVQSIGGGEAQILGSNLIEFLPDTSGIARSGRTGVQPTYGFRIPSIAGEPTGINEGQTFSVQRANTVQTFEFDNDGIVGANRIAVPIAISVDGLAANVVNAINRAGLALNATFTPGGFIAVGSQVDLRLQSLVGMQVVGSPGRSASNRIGIDLLKIVTNTQVAELTSTFIQSFNLPGLRLTQYGPNILVEGARGVAGPGVNPVNGIRDIAGNAMRATELDGTTRTTIFLGEGLDYGDLPAPYVSRRADNGPRHIAIEGFSLGPSISADADARLPDIDDDNGVTIGQLTAAYPGTLTVNVNGASPSRIAFVHAWIDYNGNAIFESSEKLRVLETFTNGDFAIQIDEVPFAAVTDRDVGVRVRLSTTRELVAIGAGSEGEVEDYFTRISRNPHQNPRDQFDVNNDGAVSSIDVLQLINHINKTGGGRLPIDRLPPPFLDTNGDGTISSLDVLALINHINSRRFRGNAEGEGEGEGDMWIPASSGSSTVSAAPAIAPSAGLVGEGEPTFDSENDETQTLDDYLAQAMLPMGPAMDEEIDWSIISISEDDEKENQVDHALGCVLDDLFR